MQSLPVPSIYRVALVSTPQRQSPTCGGAVSTDAVLLAAAVKVAPLAAALLEDTCLHYQGRPPAIRKEKERLCFAALIEKDTELFLILKRLLQLKIVIPTLRILLRNTWGQ